MSTPHIVTVPGVTPIFQVAAGDADVDTGQARYDAAHYDVYPEATYSGLDAQWTDDSCDVLEAVTWLGRQRTAEAFQVGTATVVVANPDGLWDYPPTSELTPLTIRPGRQARVGVQVGGAAPVWLWHGWVDATQPGYDPASSRQTVTVNCVCAKGQSGRVEAGRVTTAVGAGETVTARMTRLADVAGFPAHRRQFDLSGVALTGTQLGGRVAQLADGFAQSAGGDVAGDENGMLRYLARDWQTRGPGVPPDGYIGNRGVTGEVCPNGWEVLFQRSDFATRIVYGRTGEDPAQLDDVTNQGRYGVETFTMTALSTVDQGELNNVATRMLKVRSFDLAPRIAACTLDAARPGVVALLTAASPFTPSMYVCGHVDAGRAVFTRTMYLTGIAHTITPGKWTARLALDDASPFVVPADTRYDTARYDADLYTRTA